MKPSSSLDVDNLDLLRSNQDRCDSACPSIVDLPTIIQVMSTLAANPDLLVWKKYSNQVPGSVEPAVVALWQALSNSIPFDSMSKIKVKLQGFFVDNEEFHISINFNTKNRQLVYHLINLESRFPSSISQ